MRILLASILLVSVMGQPVPAAAATLNAAAASVSGTSAGSVVAGFSPCTLFPFLPWCPK